MERIRIGLIGAGFIGIAHATAIETILSEKLAAGDFFAVCDQDASRAKMVSESFGAQTFCTDPVQLIKSGDINTIFICTPTKFHPELVEAAAKQRLNIFCEKPLACSYDLVKQMRETVRQADVKNQVGLVLRYSPVYNVIRQLMSDERLGRPMSITFRDDQYFPIRGIYRSTWRRDVDIAGGGALIEHSIHDTDVLQWLLGDIASVSGFVNNFAGHKGIEDLASAHIRFSNGCVGHLLSAWHNILQRESNRYVEIFFENGCISSSDDFIGSVSFQIADGEMKTIPSHEVLGRYLELVGLSDPKYNSLHFGQGLQNYHFLKALQNGEAPQPDFNVAARAHEVVEAIYRAARNGEEINLPLGS